MVSQICSQSVSTEKLFWLSSYEVENNQCEPRLPNEANKFSTCMWGATKWSDEAFGRLFTMDAVGNCNELGASTVIPGAVAQGTQSAPIEAKSSSVGVGASLAAAPIAGAAVLGMAIMRRKNGGKKRAPKLNADEANGML